MGILDAPSLTKSRADALYGTVPGELAFVSGAAHPLTRRATLTLNSPSNTNAASTIDWTQRVPFRLPVKTVRWRLKVGNVMPATGTAYTQPITITGVWTGVGTYNSGNQRPDGNFTATPSQALSSFSVPTDGTDYTSPWVTSSSLQFSPDVLNLVSMGFTGTATGTGNVQSAAFGSVALAVAASGSAGNQTLGGGFSKTVLDCRIEYEFVGSNKIGLYIGDSLTEGQGDGDIGAANRGVFPHEAFPGVAGMQNRTCWINGGVSGVTAAAWSTTTSRLWTRFDLTTCPPDFAVIFLGTNDIVGGGVTATTVKGYITTIINNCVNTLGIKRVYVCTIIPRSFSVAALTAAATSGSGTLQANVNGFTGTVTLDSGANQESINVSSISGASSPYTWTLSSNTTKAHLAGAQVFLTPEQVRRQINDWLRNVPMGAHGCFDFDRTVAAGIDANYMDPAFVSADATHLYRAGYQRLGGVAAVR